MKKYLITASLFLFNSEVISWLALTIIAAIALAEFAKAVDIAHNDKILHDLTDPIEPLEVFGEVWSDAESHSR